MKSARPRAIVFAAALMAVAPLSCAQSATLRGRINGLETVVKERSEWKDFYRADRESA